MPNFMSVKYLVYRSSRDGKRQAKKPPHKLVIRKTAILPPASTFPSLQGTNLETYIHLFFPTLTSFFGDMKNGQVYLSRELKKMVSI